MLTKEQNELLCRVEGDAPMGQLARRHWLPVCLSEEVRRARRHAGARAPAGRGPGGVPRQRGPARRAGRALPAPPRVAGCSGATRTAACAACTTAGSSTSTATCSTCPRRRRARRSAWARRPRPIRRAKAAASSGSGWARGTSCASSSRRPGRRAGHQVRDREDARRVQLGAGARGLDRFGAQLEPAFHQHAGRPRSRARRRPTRRGCGRRPTRRRACSSSATSYGFRYAAIRKPIRNPETHQYVRTTLFIAPFTVLIPPNDQYNLAQMLRADRRREHDVLLDRLAPGSDEGHHAGGLAQVLRGRSRRRPRRELPQEAHPATTATCRTAPR